MSTKTGDHQVALGLFLPLLGASMLTGFALEWLLLRRLTTTRQWLGIA